MTEGLADDHSHGFNNVAIGNLEKIQTGNVQPKIFI